MTITNYDDGVVQTSDSNDQDLVARTVYDAVDRRVNQVDAAERHTAFAYDLQDHLLTVTENVAVGTCTTAPCDVQTTYAYDRAGNRTALTDANSHTRTFAYDAADQQTRASDALQRVATWEYDAGGRATAQLVVGFVGRTRRGQEVEALERALGAARVIVGVLDLVVHVASVGAGQDLGQQCHTNRELLFCCR